MLHMTNKIMKYPNKIIHTTNISYTGFIQPVQRPDSTTSDFLRAAICAQCTGETLLKQKYAGETLLKQKCTGEILLKTKVCRLDLDLGNDKCAGGALLKQNVQVQIRSGSPAYHLHIIYEPFVLNILHINGV